MKEFSKKNIECLYGWLDENPNKDMITDGVSVIVVDCLNNRYRDPDIHCGFNVREYIFQTKEEAWLFFEKDFSEHGMCGRDFWHYVEETGNLVVSTHYDEGGWTHVWIEKWDGFKDDVHITYDEYIKYDIYGSEKEFQYPNIALSKSFQELCDKKKIELAKLRVKFKEPVVFTTQKQSNGEELPF